MRTRLLLVLLAGLLLSVVMGCGSSSPSTANNSPTPPAPQPPSAPSPAPAPPPATATFVYVANNGSDQHVGGSVSAFRVAANGSLTPVPGSPFAAGNGPSNIGSDPQGHFVFVAEDGSVPGARGSNCNSVPSTILAEAVDAATGALAQVDQKALSGVCARAVAVDPSGKDLYIAMGHANDALGEIQGFLIGPNGTLTELPGSPFQVNGFPTGLAVHANGKFVYAASNSGLLVMSRDAATGALVETGDFNTPKNRLALNPAGTFLAASEVNSNEISQFHVDPATGAVEAVDFRPPASGPLGVAADPLGTFFAVTETLDSSSMTGGVSTFLLNSATHQLDKTNGSPFVSGHGTVDAAFDPSGAFVYAVNRQDRNVTAYVLDRASGGLSAVAGSPFNTGGDFPDSLVVITMR